MINAPSSARVGSIMSRATSALLGIGLAVVDYDLIGGCAITGQGNDIDILVLVSGSITRANYQNLSELDLGGSENIDADERWVSLTTHNRQWNLILVSNERYYFDWLKAVEVCRFLHLRGVNITKGTRHGIHEIFMDDSDANREHGRRAY